MTDTAKPLAQSPREKDAPRKKPYESPRVVSHDALEVIASACAAPNGKEIIGTCLVSQS
jgi:hypothetical protein